MKKFSLTKYLPSLAPSMFMTIASCAIGTIVMSGYPDVESLTVSQLATIIFWAFSTTVWAAITIIAYNNQCIKELKESVAELKVTEEELQKPSVSHEDSVAL